MAAHGSFSHNKVNSYNIIIVKNLLTQLVQTFLIIDSFLSVSFSNELQEESVASNEKLRAIRKARVRKILNDRGLNQVVKAFDSNSVKV